jgi:hypothetical protein
MAGSSEVRQVPVPASALALSTLERVDYGDAFVVGVDAVRERTAEQWVAAILEGAPAKVRYSLVAGWSALGLRLDRGEESVLGWPVRRSTAGTVLLGADSSIGMEAELLLQRRRGSLLFCTFVHQGNPAARALWAGIEPVHVPIVRSVLAHAARAGGLSRAVTA